MGYIKEIDAIRAVAIFFVICNHWLPVHSLLYNFSTIVSAPDIFFTISGFLITTILLKDREKAEVRNTSKIFVYKVFFIKRALRIFPAYFLTILVTYLLKKDSVPNYTSYLFFTANFDMYNNQYWGYLTHLWSMSVEQQFYLFWPLIVLFIPKKLLLPSIILFIAIGILSQHLIQKNDFISMLPQTCFDALGIGALLAWIVVFNYQLLGNVHKMLRILAIISIILIISQHIWNHFFYLSHRTLVAIITMWAITYFIVTQNKVKSNYYTFIFNNKAVLGIGKISYGIYLYHLTLFFHSNKILAPLNSFLLLPNFVKNSRSFFLLENLIILIGLSFISWKFFELPISNLKKYFKNKKEEVSPNKKSLINVA